jgi:hypothetical protein
VSIVDFRVIFFTVPEKFHTSIKSQITKGFANNIEKDENKSDKIFCNAKATAIDATHRLATNGVKFTQMLVKKINIQIPHTKIFIISSIALCQATFQRNTFDIAKVKIFIKISQAPKSKTNKRMIFIQ